MPTLSLRCAQLNNCQIYQGDWPHGILFALEAQEKSEKVHVTYGRVLGGTFGASAESACECRDASSRDQIQERTWHLRGKSVRRRLLFRDPRPDSRGGHSNCLQVRLEEITSARRVQARR